jgi:hypothetical protein
VGFVDPMDGEPFPGAPIVFEVLAEADDGSGVGVAEVRLRIDGVDWIDALGRTGDEVPPYRFADVSVASDGVHELELVAIDHFGNLAQANATIVVGEVGDTETGDEDSESEGESETDGADELPPDGCGCAIEREPGALARVLLIFIACGYGRASARRSRR